MGLFDDMSQFLEERLDEFLKQHPHLELQALEEQLREQEVKTQQLIQSLLVKEQQLQAEVLAIAEDIKLWHQRIAKAEAVQRWDLVEPAREREASLLRQGNQTWGQLAGVKENLEQSRTLLHNTQLKRKEVQQEMARTPKTSQAPRSPSPGWEQPKSYQPGRDRFDPVEASFREWELEQELQHLKREMGR